MFLVSYTFYFLCSTAFAFEIVICSVYYTACQWHTVPCAVFFQINKLTNISSSRRSRMFGLLMHCLAEK